ncbi:MAG: acetylxylan esterase [Solirubrobacterales bacterium]|nr:acetylxylan esterase [Solirubrobacterales bacterium]
MGRSRVGVVTAMVVGALGLPAAAQAAEPPLGLTCTPQNGVRFCPGNGTTERFKSFDGVPLDVDVTLPPSGDGPFPTIVMLHGYGGNKGAFETTSEDPSTTSGTRFHYNNNHFAKQGYAVVNSTARGFGESCGSLASRLADPTGCAMGWIHLIDQRYEIRDTQEILGALTDQGVTKADAIGVTGVSYGGGQSTILATLKDRIRNVDGSYKPWTSPKGTPLSIAAAWPRWPWTDLVYSLVPNGRLRDDQIAGPTASRAPYGVAIQSYVAGLFTLGATSGYYAPPLVDPAADIITWFAQINAGEPYEGNPQIKALADEIYLHHGAYSLIDGTNGPTPAPSPAPLLIQNGFTDDLFPIGEALRFYNRLRQLQGPGADVALQFGDLGHARGQNKRDPDVAFNTQGAAFFASHLKGESSATVPVRGSVSVFTQTCPKAAKAGGPLLAPSWEAAHPGILTLSSPAGQTVTSVGGDLSKAAGTDPIAASGSACATFPGSDDAGTANYRMGESLGFTMLGRPTITAKVALTGLTGQLVGRLWDVGTDGKQTLVTRGVYRLNPADDGTITFQLNGNGYRFEKGHTPKLELVGSSAPTYRATNGAFSVAVSDLKLTLPTVEKPGETVALGPNGTVQAPAASGTSSAFTRQRPRRIVVRVSPRRGDRRAPYRFTTRGTVLLPKGFTRKESCSGRVSIQVKAGKRTISLRRARLSSKCSFRRSVTFSNSRRFNQRRSLKFTVRFLGNDRLLRKNAKSLNRRVR